MGWHFLPSQGLQGTIGIPSATPGGISPIQDLWTDRSPRSVPAPLLWVRAAAAILALWLPGALSLAAAGIRPARGDDGLVMDAAAGALLLGVFGSLAVTVGLRLWLLPLYLLAIALAAAAHIRGNIPTVRSALPRDRAALALCGVAVALLGVLVTSAAGDRLWWDGRVMWGLKAQVLFHHGTLPAWFFDPAKFPNPDYPLGVPLVSWWIFEHAGEPAAALVSFAGAMWFALLVLLLWAVLRRTDEQVAAVAALGIASFWPLSSAATGGTADVVMAIALLGVLVEFERGSAGDSASWWRAAVYLSLGVLAKNEGLALALVAGIIGVTYRFRSGGRSARASVPFMLPLVIAAPWLIFTRRMQAPFNALPSNPQFGTLLERIPVLWSGITHELSFSPWIPLPLLVAIGIVASVRTGQPRILCWSVMASYFACICAVYLQAPVDLNWLLQTSLSRVLSVLVPAAVYLSIASAARHGERNDRTGRSG